MAENIIEENELFDNISTNKRLWKEEILEENEVMQTEEEANRTKIRKISTCEAKCDSKNCKLSMVEQSAFCICYLCNMFLCEMCLRRHDKSHEFVKKHCDGKEKVDMEELFVERMRREKISDKEFYEMNIKIYGRVYLKHELDKVECNVTGLCGLQDNMLAVLDHYNTCMKIFSSVTNKLLRYVLFKSRPSDATEIIVNTNLSDRNLASYSKSEASGAVRGKPELAVTFTSLQQIWIIDLNKRPARKTKTIQLYKPCRSICFYADRIFTHCSVKPGPHSSVDILSTEGEILKVIQLGVPGLFADIVVYWGSIYIIDSKNDRILCINVENGETSAELYIKESWLRGICIDDNKNVYASGLNSNTVFKLSSDIRRFEPLQLDREYTLQPWRICFKGGKFFVSHFWDSSDNNVVTVVQLT